MRMTVDLPPDLLQRLRSEARQRGRSITTVLEEALRRGLGSDQARELTAVPLPTFAMGAPRPGIDLHRALATALDGTSRERDHVR